MSANQYGNVFLLRHGQTISNSLRYWSNYPDEGLTEVGISQATEIGKRIGSLEFHKIYASPMKRCLETIEYSLGSDAVSRSIFVDGLKERELSGVNEMTSAEIEARYDVNVGTVLSSGLDIIPGVETSEDFVKRATTNLREIFSEIDGGNVLIVSHGGTMCAFLRSFMGIEPEPRTFLNCAFLGLDFDGNSFFPRVSINMKEDWYSPVNPSWRGLKL